VATSTADATWASRRARTRAHAAHGVVGLAMGRGPAAHGVGYGEGAGSAWGWLVGAGRGGQRRWCAHTVVPIGRVHPVGSQSTSAHGAEFEKDEEEDEDEERDLSHQARGGAALALVVPEQVVRGDRV
jgi:hypothetical protein